MTSWLTIERLRELPPLGGTDEPYLANLAAAACGAVEEYCKRRFAMESYDQERHDGTGEESLFLRNFPVVSVEAAIVLLADGGSMELAPPDLEINRSTGELRIAAGPGYMSFQKGFQNVTVSYTAGFQVVPEPVVEAAAQLAAWLQESAFSHEGLAAERIGDYSRTLRGATSAMWPTAVLTLLAPYRNVRA